MAHRVPARNKLLKWATTAFNYRNNIFFVEARSTTRNGNRGTLTRRGCRTLLWLDVSGSDHLAPLFRLLDDNLVEFSKRASELSGRYR